MKASQSKAAWATTHPWSAEMSGAEAGLYIRKAELEDTPALLRLFEAHAAFERAAPPRATAQTLEMALSEIPPPVIIWVLTGQEVQGFASASFEFSTWHAQPYLHLDCLYLEPEVRGLGWGRKLLDTVVCHAERSGYNELQWQTPVWNDGAIGFYEALGAESSAKMRFRLVVSGFKLYVA